MNRWNSRSPYLGMAAPLWAIALCVLACAASVSAGDGSAEDAPPTLQDLREDAIRHWSVAARTGDEEQKAEALEAVRRLRSP